MEQNYRQYQSDEWRVMSDACKYGNIYKVTELFECEGSIFPNYIKYPLYWAMLNNKFNIIEYFVQQWDVDLHSNEEYLLRVAAGVGQLEMVTYLVSKGADVNVMGGSVLRRAVEGGHHSVVKYLIETCGMNVQLLEVERLVELEPEFTLMVAYLVKQGVIFPKKEKGFFKSFFSSRVFH